MNGYNFTDRVRKVLQMAREEAARLHHDYVGTEHLLLGLLDEGEGVAIAVLMNLGAHPTKVREAVTRSLAPGKGGGAGPDIPYTAPAKKVLELAMSEARDLVHSFVGTEHLLLGLLREQKGIAGQVLESMDVTLEVARAEMLRLLTGSVDPTYRARLAQGPDQQFKSAIALIELHRLRFGTYPATLGDLRFLGYRDEVLLEHLEYERLGDGYSLSFPGGGPQPPLAYPEEFWRGLGILHTNVGRDTDS